jgi:hypothetical protein
MKTEIRKTNRNSWEQYISNIQNGIQRREVLMSLYKTEINQMQLNRASKDGVDISKMYGQ